MFNYAQNFINIGIKCISFNSFNMRLKNSYVLQCKIRAQGHSEAKLVLLNLGNFKFSDFKTDEIALLTTKPPRGNLTPLQKKQPFSYYKVV